MLAIFSSKKLIYSEKNKYLRGRRRAKSAERINRSNYTIKLSIETNSFELQIHAYLIGSN